MALQQDAIASGRGPAAESEPSLAAAFAVEEAQQGVLVIALEEDAFGRCHGLRDQAVEDGPAARAAIDVVPEVDDGRLSRAGRGCEVAPDRVVQPRSEERSGGKECVSQVRSRWWPYH